MVKIIGVLIALVANLALADPSTQVGISLDDKLRVNFSQYENARKLLLDNHRNAIITDRDALESALYPGARFVIQDEDELALRNNHEAIIEQNRRQNEITSKFELDALRRDRTLLRKFLFELPKGGMLHNHAGATASMKTVREILERVNPRIDIQEDILDRTNKWYSYLYTNEKNQLEQFPPVGNYSDYNDYQKNFFINLLALPQDGRAHPFPRFSAIFQIAKVLGKTEDKDLRAWVRTKVNEDFVETAGKHNVSYVEFTVGFDYADNIEQFEWWARKWEKKYGVIARWNMAFIRIRDNAANADLFDEFSRSFSEKPSDVLVGIDFIADETKAPALDNGQTLYLLALEFDQRDDAELHRTMHAGELGHPHNPRDAILLGAERLGHGVKLNDDVLTLEWVRARIRTPIVINLSSNVQLGVVASVEKHPFLRFLRLGIPISFSTDDEGMFVTNISNEFFKAVVHTDINYSELKQITYNGINNSFADGALKAKLKIDLDERYRIFESRWEKILSADEDQRAFEHNYSP